MYNLFLISIALLLVLLNALFVAAEFGMVKLRATKVEAIKKSYGLRGRILAQVHAQLDAYLSACQLGITLASLGLGWIGEPAFAYLFEPFFESTGLMSPRLVTIISFLIAFFIISFLHIVVGELMPKSLAIRRSETISIWTALPLYGFYWLMYPLIWLLNNCSNFFLNKMGVDVSHAHDGFYTSDELKLILNSSHLHGELEARGKDIIAHTLDLAELKVTEVMRTSDEMKMVFLQDPIEKSARTILENRYTRYPVFDESSKQIVGIIHVKDLISDLLSKQSITSLTPYIRPVLKVPHVLPAMDLLRKFQDGMPHFALVYKHSTTLIGFITLDNLLHVLLGRIKDEFHKTHDDWIQNPDGSILARGDCSIYSLERALGQDISVSPEEEGLYTLYGLIINRLGRVPQEGEIIHFKEFDAIIEKVQDQYILQILVKPTIKPG